MLASPSGSDQVQRLLAEVGMLLTRRLVGNSIVSADVSTGRLVLSDGTVLQVAASNDECCSFVNLTALRTVGNVITAVRLEDEDGAGESLASSPYRAWVSVLTDAGELVDVAEAAGDATSGYYLHGFALPVTVVE